MCAVKFIINIFFLLNVHNSLQCPIDELVEAKAAYKSGEKQEQSPLPVTIAQIKLKLKESGIFDENTASLNERERKELKKFFEVVEVMTSSRNRQPQNIQNMFSSLRMMERVLKKQLKEGQISETLASKFQWEKLSNRPRRDNYSYRLDKTTNMRVFTLN